MYLLSLIVAFGLVGLPLDVPGADRPTKQQDPCRAETEQTRSIVMRYATGDDFADTRQRHGIPTFRPEEVRLLTSPGDARICRRIPHLFQQMADRANRMLGRNDAVPLRSATFYQVGDYYIAVGWGRETTSRRTADGVSLTLGSWVPLIVADQNLNLVATTAM